MNNYILPHINSNKKRSRGFSYWKDGFPENELEKIDNLILDVDTNGIDKIEYSGYSSWLFDKVGRIITILNDSHFGFNLSYLDNFEFVWQSQEYSTKYSDPQIDNHLPEDSNLDKTRKLVCIIQLSDPKSYVGGEIEINGCPPTDITKDKGSVLLFPSFSAYRMTPVTSGDHLCLITRVVGPDFR